MMINYRKIIKIGAPIAIIGVAIPAGIVLSLKSCTPQKSNKTFEPKSNNEKAVNVVSEEKIEKGDDIFKDIISNDFYKFVRLKRHSNGIKAEFDEDFEGAIISTVLKKNIKNIENGTVAWATNVNEDNNLFTIIFQWIIDNKIQATKAYSFQITDNLNNNFNQKE